MDKDKKQESYPQPSSADQQQKHQPEFIDQQPNDFDDKSISDLPTVAERQANNPLRDLKKEQ